MDVKTKLRPNHDALVEPQPQPQETSQRDSEDWESAPTVKADIASIRKNRQSIQVEQLHASVGPERSTDLVEPTSDELSKDLASLRIERDTSRHQTIGHWRTVTVVVTIILGLVVYGLIRTNGGLVRPKVATGEVTTISPVQASILISATGYLVPERVSKISAKVVERARHVLVKDGDTVRSGQVLVILENEDLRSAITAAHARASAARARVESAKSNLAEVTQKVVREQFLFDKNATNRASLEELIARQEGLARLVVVAEAEVQVADAEERVLVTGMNDRTIRAPIDGTVISKPVEVGEIVGPNALPVVEIADLGTLFVEVDVPEGRVHMVHVGWPCEIVLDAYPEKHFWGEVTEIGNQVDRAKATVKVKVGFTRHETEGLARILPDMSARVSFHSRTTSGQSSIKTPTAIVPASAVVERNGRKCVFVLEEGTIRLVPIELGSQTGDGIEVYGGPQNGTRVVINPLPELVDGQKVDMKGEL